MGDPVRLVSAATSHAARELLRNARIGAPPGLKERAMSAALDAFAAPGATAGAAAAQASSLVNVHWVGLACVVGVCTAGGILAARAQHDPASADPQTGYPTPARRLHPSAAAPTVAVTASDDWSPVSVDVTSLPAATQTQASPPVRSVESPVPSARPAPNHDDAPTLDVAAPAPKLSSEILSLDLTRKALAAADGHRALFLLHDYDARFPDGALRSEAVMLRIEALAAVGREAEAARLGRDVIESDPDGPYVARIQSLLGDAKP